MAGNQQSAVVYLRKTWGNLVTKMQNFPVIVENLHQRRVFNDYDVGAVKAMSTEPDKARYILKRVTNQGECASYELLKILDFTWKRTLHPSLHKWIKRYSFREDSEANSSFGEASVTPKFGAEQTKGTAPCQHYLTQLKMKAKSILENQREHRSKYLLHKQQENFHFIPLASKKETVKREQSYSSQEEYVEMGDGTYSSDAEVECLYIEPFSLKSDSVIKKTKFEAKNKKRRKKKLGAHFPNKEETVSPEDLLTMQNKNILLFGKPGIGKTTIAQQMLHLWTEKTIRVPDYMFYFDETIVSHSSNLMNLDSLLFDVYVKAKEEDQQEVLQDMKDNVENVVFIFDGVTRLQEDSVLKKIMNHDVLRKAKVIITCRTEMEKDSLFSDWPTQKVYVQGFSEESIRIYYQMMLGHNPDLLNVVLNNQELFSLSYVPMYAFMIANMILLKDDTVLNNPHTVTNMNIHIFFNALMKYGDKNLLEIDEYLKEIKDQLDLLMKNAFSATEQKSLNLPEISGDETDICHAFLKMITIRDSLTSETKYCAFLHNTMQEFFSALWLVENPDEIEKVLKLCQTEESQHMRHVLPFLCGLLGEHNNKLLKCLFSEDQMKKTSERFIEKLSDTFLKPQSDGEDVDLLYVCQCLYELQSSNACLMFLEKMKHQLDIDVNLDPHQSCAFSYVISQSRDKEVHLNLQDFTVSDSGMIMILFCTPKIRLKPCNAAFNQIKVLLQFIHKVSVNKTTLEGEKRKRSHCCCNSFHNNTPELGDALLDLYSHVKDYETQTGRSFLPALQPVFQSSPDVWFIDLSERKSSILLEVLKLQTEKKPVELRGWTDEESEVMSFIQCLPHISQLGLRCSDENTETSAVQFLLSLIVAAESEMTTIISSLCSYKTFPFQSSGNVVTEIQCDFLLDLYSHVKDYETQTGRSLLPALQRVYIQSTPDVWIIDLSKRKASILLEVLKLQTEKKPVVLIGWTDEESEVMSFLHCLPYISQLSFINRNISERTKFLLKVFIKAAETERLTGDQMLELLTSVWSYSFSFSKNNDNVELCDFLFDLYLYAKDYETQTSKSVLPALQQLYRLVPTVWSIDLSERKTSILLEVLKLQTEKKPVVLRGWTDEESEVMSFLHCLPYISQLRCNYSFNCDATSFLLKLFIKAAEAETQTGDQMLKQLTSVCKYTSFPYENCDNVKQSDFLLDLYSHVKDYETQTGRSFLPAIQSVYQTAPDVWIIDLSERKASILLEVLKLQTVKKPVELKGWRDEESEMMSFLQCLPYISQLSFVNGNINEQTKFLLKLFIKAAETERLTGDQMLKLLTPVWSHNGCLNDNNDNIELCDFLLDLYSHAKNYENQTGNRVLPGLHQLYHLVPTVWFIDLSKRKTSILLEVLKLQTEKKPVELIDWSDEESEVMSFLQCLPYISQLRVTAYYTAVESRILSKLFIKAAESQTHTGDQMLELLTSVCTYTSFPFKNIDNTRQSVFLLDIYSHVKDYETQTGRSLLPALQSVYQTAPDVWIIDLSKRKTSILLEVLKLQTEKKPVELRGWTDEESEVMSFLQCLPYISQLRFDLWNRSHTFQCVLKLFIKAAETETQTGDQMLKLLTSVCTYRNFPFECMNIVEQSDFLLDIYSHVKDYETQTGRSLLPALQSVYQTAPDVWIIDLSKRKTSILLEVLKLQTEKKPVELRGWTDEESEVMSFLQCLPYISQLRFDLWNSSHTVQCVSELFTKAAETETQTGDQMLKLLTSVCTYTTFPYEDMNSSRKSDFLLDLYSHVKDYETQSGRSFLPALQSVYQTAPDVWIIDLSQRKTSILLEVLKLQTEKKPVVLRGWTDEESEVMSFLHCLPYISQLRFDLWNRSHTFQCVLKLFIKAAETETQTGDQMIKLLTSVCTYRNFPFECMNIVEQSDFLLDLYSHVKDYETQTGRSLLPALQSVYQTAPDVWIIDLSERNTYILLEVLKLQTEKKPVELRGWRDEESEVMSFLQCLPYISQLRSGLFTIVNVFDWNAYLYAYLAYINVKFTKII
ncbi:uncharacterized protein LOC130561820 isoform X2 [Triplophysa rosa]|uniref:uncharacterized protein LOC130561820 isoform X2 n=1 Tax=Triplophysa rosa TaxID=992332 RepID=UPI002545C19A|nr:uncharacterized protein LOC130561820 isoform X2 [Triplophysa rosa]